MRRHCQCIVLLMAINILSGCGGSSSNDESSNIVVSTTTSTTHNTLAVNLLPNVATTQTGTFTVTGAYVGPLTYQIISSPSYGSVTLTNATAGEYTYTVPSTITTARKDSFQFTVSDGNKTETSTIQISLNTDPLYQHQWHLDNTGQSNFASIAGTAGEDINIDSVIAAGYTGQGITVAVVDEGLEIAHEDLQGNIVANGSWDFVNNDTDPTRSTTDSHGDHGTSVAGLIAASGWNNKGGRGVSPKVSLKGFNFLQNQLLNNKIAALGGASYSQDVDIFVLSFGVNVIVDYLIDSTFETAIANIMTTLRGGKGPIYVKAAGNGFEKYSGLYLNSNGSWESNQANCNNATSTKLTCQNANMDQYNTLPYNIVVSALTGEGIKSSYSTAGSAIWISAPGGEYGHNRAYVTSADYKLKPGMMTTDQSGCSQGYVRNDITDSNGFNPNHINNSSCNYTSTFNGTSSAVPVTSGTIALMLEANPNLGWRDVKHILARTATQVDTTLTDTTVSLSGSDYIAEPTWLTNNAGYQFHNYYGFGRIDVASAVNMAKTYSINSLGNFRTSDWQSSGALNKTITNYNITSVAEHQLTNSQKMIIEAVQIKVNITHDRTGDLGIELISPNGTRSVLFNINNGFSDDQNLANMVLLSNAFYGESSSGQWTIRVVDGYSTGSNGTMVSWAIRFFGH